MLSSVVVLLILLLLTPVFIHPDSVSDISLRQSVPIHVAGGRVGNADLHNLDFGQ
jgi:hypothetical protein